jgi:hypothetical protein
LIIDNGTYNVHPANTPPSINIPNIIIINESYTNQRDNAFNRGNIISEEHNIRGNNRLPNPPINIGMIIKNIIKIA